MKMKVNRKTVLIKAHYFALFAGMVPVMPFFIVLGVGLGVPIAIQGILGSVVLISTVFAKPLLSLLADSFPQCRKHIFVGAVLAAGLCLGSICIVAPFGKKPCYSRVILVSKGTNFSDTLSWIRYGTELFGSCESGANVGREDLTDGVLGTNTTMVLRATMDEGIEELRNKNFGNMTWSDNILLIPKNESCRLLRGIDCIITPLGAPRSRSPAPPLQLRLLETEEAFSALGAEDLTAYEAYGVVASVKRVEEPARKAVPVGPARLSCAMGEWEGECGGKVWRTHGFWAFFLLLLVGFIAFSTANSFTDAVTVETIGPTGNYGSQRAWGSAGWGLMGPVSGLLVDWWSGPAEVKDYTPAFVMVFLFMAVDVVLTAKLKVPKLEVNTSVWSSLWPLLRQPRFLLFLFFSVLNGCFDGVVLNFLFVLQEDMAAGTGAMQHIKFIQGMTILVQCAMEVPCMYICNRLVKAIGADRVTTIVLGLHVIRLFLLTCVGWWGSVWQTVLVEILNGPCYGFGYSAIVVYAGQLAPPGASTTVQSLTNISYESIGYSVCAMLSGMLVATVGSVRLFLVWGVVGIVTTLLHIVYVRWVPPIKDGLTNPQLTKEHNYSCPGTVEEQLCLRSGDGDVLADDKPQLIWPSEDTLDAADFDEPDALPSDEALTMRKVDFIERPTSPVRNGSTRNYEAVPSEVPLVNGLEKVLAVGEEEYLATPGHDSVGCQIPQVNGTILSRKESCCDDIIKRVETNRPVSFCYVSNV